MTATPQGPHTERPAPAEPAPASRTGVLPLAAAVLLAVSGLFTLSRAFRSDALFSEALYTDTWAVLAVIVPLSTVTTLVLAAAAVARGSRVFLLVMGVGTVLHLVALVGLGLSASGSLPTPRGPNLWSGPAQLGLALLALALAWWIATRTERRPWAPLVLLAVAPLLGRLISAGPQWDWSWWPVLITALGLPATLMILAAGLICLPGRGSQIAGAALIVLAGLGVYGSSLLLGRQPHPDTLVVMGLAFVCAVAGIVLRPRHPVDDGAPTASSPEPAPEVTTMSDTAVVVVPSAHPETDEDPGGRARPSGQGRSIAALVVLVLTVALGVPMQFAHGAGIQPGGAGLPLLLVVLVNSIVPAVLTLTAGAVILRSHRVLVVASVCSGLLALAVVVSRTAAFRPVTLSDALPLIALGVALAFAWAGRARPGAGGAPVRWAANVPPWVTVVPLALVVSPLMMLISPGALAQISVPEFLTQFLLPYLLLGLHPVVAAALLVSRRRAARTAAAVLLGLLAVGGVVALLLNGAGPGAGPLALTLYLLQIGGYALACVLVLAALLTPGRPSTQAPTSARSVWAG